METTRFRLLSRNRGKEIENKLLLLRALRSFFLLLDSTTLRGQYTIVTLKGIFFFFILIELPIPNQ